MSLDSFSSLDEKCHCGSEVSLSHVLFSLGCEEARLTDSAASHSQFPATEGTKQGQHFTYTFGLFPTGLSF